MQRVHIPKLFLGQQPRWHTRPSGENDKSDPVAKHQSPSNFLERSRGESVEPVPDKGDGSGDMNHRVGPGPRNVGNAISFTMTPIALTLIVHLLVEEPQDEWSIQNQPLQALFDIDP